MTRHKHSEATPSHSGESGFTLVEALVAIVVLVFGLIAITNLMLVAGSSNTVANHMTAATGSASRTMEELKATPWGRLTVGGTVADDTQCPAFCRDDTIPGVGIVHTRWEVVQAAAPSPQTIRFIRVRSEGTGALTRARSRAEFTTFRTCTDPSLTCLLF